MNERVKKSTHCVVCIKPIEYQSLTSPHPESPEFVCCGDWFGVYTTLDGATKFIACCSEQCVQTFLREGDADAWDDSIQDDELN